GQDAPRLRDAVRVTAALGAVVEVVAPAHVVLVQQPGEVGPRVRGRVVRGRAPRRGAARAAHRVMARAGRRPAGGQGQVGGQAPGAAGLERHVVEHEVLRVRPVVRDVGAGVVPHHVQRLAGAGARAAAALGLGDEAVYLPVVDVPGTGGIGV